MPTQTFNCTGAGTTITPLPRPYYCCGWGVAPSSFSGRYTCTTSGGPPPYDFCDATNKPFSLILTSICRDNGTYYYTQTGDPAVLSGYPPWARVSLNLCVLPDGSDGASTAFILAEPPVPEDITSFSVSCSYNSNSGAYSFNLQRVTVTTISPGYTVTTTVIIDTVTMP